MIQDSVIVIRRNKSVTDFDSNKITTAITKAMIAVNGEESINNSNRQRELIHTLTDTVVTSLLGNKIGNITLHIEDIQDQVELALMRAGEHQVARAYVLYREQHKKQRTSDQPTTAILLDTDKPLDIQFLQKVIASACNNLEGTDPELILKETLKNLYNGVSLDQAYDSALLACRTLIEKDPAYSYVTARLLLHTLHKEVLGKEVDLTEIEINYRNYFPIFIRNAIQYELLDGRLGNFDLEYLASKLVSERDLQFDYLGLQTLYDRYFLHHNEKRIELPQIFFMRVAMGLALNEENKEEWAIKFYDILSKFDFMSSTPTLFNSGTKHSQLSSCYLTTVPDDLDGIYEALKENALLSKFAGGLGNDWTRVRALGSHIKGTNGKSQGVVPFLKVVNDTAVAVNQGGKRKGAVCAYLETWHLDIEEFLELRKNTGDDRRRTHDMNTANWIPDLFMKRVIEGGDWTLFSPSDCPDLHDLYGKAFEQRYHEYEELAKEGKIKHKIVSAVQLWRKMLGMLFETGHPWITFKDPCNIRSPQQHIGVVHSSNLCVAPETELLTSKGYIPIQQLEDKEVDVWNGEEWSRSTVRKTGTNQSVLTIEFSNGKSIDCTPYHKFYVRYRGKDAELEAQDLEQGDLIQFTLPNNELQIISVTGIQNKFRLTDTYCLNEPKRHRVIFNGILTGNCTEITLNTNDEEIAVCNLGSVNLVQHLSYNSNGKLELDVNKLSNTIQLGMRMLDNVIDINFYPVKKAENSNLKHRPVGLGIMGFQECLYKLRIPYSTQEAVEFADRSMEMVALCAYQASSLLAKERGRYSTYDGSLWSQNIFPLDTLSSFEEQRTPKYLNIDKSESLDWNHVRELNMIHGMRNSTCLAIAPTATISNIVGVSASIEPTYQNLYVKSNLSGEFTIINSYLVQDLKELGLWDEVMIADLKYYDGAVSKIERIPQHLKELYATAFEIDPIWLVEAAARRQKWVDQAQSLNIYVSGVSGKKLDEIYKLAWIRGLKSTYYLRSQAATHIEKSTTQHGTLNSVATEEYAGPVCTLRPGDPGFEECESCQ
jgi:ribonucleotide reductase alpha subunit